MGQLPGSWGLLVVSDELEVGCADPAGCCTGFPPSPVPGRRGPPAPFPPAPCPGPQPGRLFLASLHSAEPGGAPRGCQGLDTGMSEAPALASGPLLPRTGRAGTQPLSGPRAHPWLLCCRCECVWGMRAPDVVRLQARQPLSFSVHPGVWAAVGEATAQVASAVGRQPLQRASHYEPPSLTWPCTETRRGPAGPLVAGNAVGRSCSGSWGAALP